MTGNVEGRKGLYVQIRVTEKDKAIYKAAALQDNRSLSSWFTNLAINRIREQTREREREELRQAREDGLIPPQVSVPAPGSIDDLIGQ